MYAIIGLGNPGEKYAHTRHNAGFLAADFLASAWGFPAFSEESRFRAFVSAGLVGETKTIVAKPQTFMNLSGESVRALAEYFKISSENILLLHDDKDFALGELRLARGSSSAGHRGVKSVFDHFGTQDIARIRIGIGVPPENIPTDAYVLSRFSPEERETLEDTFPEIQRKVEDFLKSLLMSSPV